MPGRRPESVRPADGLGEDGDGLELGILDAVLRTEAKSTSHSLPVLANIDVDAVDRPIEDERAEAPLCDTIPTGPGVADVGEESERGRDVPMGS